MNNNKDKFMEELKLNIALQNCIENLNSESSKKEEKRKRGFFMKKKIIATACASLVLVSGIVIATNVQKNKEETRGLGEGIDTAIENGYIAEPNIEFVNAENVGIDVKIENFLMDDTTLSVNFVVDFDENILDEIDMEKVTNIELSDLIVRDEEDRIIYSLFNKEAFEKYCKENNLNYTYGEYNENYMNNGLNCFMSTKTDNSIKMTYNMYAQYNLPKSKKLYFSFNTIKVRVGEYTFEKWNEYEINGEWKAQVDVPEEMYNRTEEHYEVVSCDNADFEVYASKVTSTGFEIGAIISNIEPLRDKYQNIAHPIQVTEAFEGEKR